MNDWQAYLSPSYVLIPTMLASVIGVVDERRVVDVILLILFGVYAEWAIRRRVRAENKEVITKLGAMKDKLDKIDAAGSDRVALHEYDHHEVPFPPKEG